MREPMRIIALSALVLPPGFVAQSRTASSSISGEYKKVLKDPWRDAWQKPQKVLSALEWIRAKYVKLTGNGPAVLAAK
jgi:hypothetical protein